MAKRISTKNLSVEDTAELDQYLLETENKPAELLKKLRKFKPINQTQSELEREIYNKDLVFVTGSAGTGKTFAALWVALNMIKDKTLNYNTISLSKSVVQIKGEEVGFIPGPQPLTAKVATPQGWSYMGDLKKGDYVLGRDGKPTKILNIFKKGIKPVYDVVMNDGRKTQACGDHVWATQKYDGSFTKLRSTLDIKKHIEERKIRIKIPMAEPLLYEGGTLPINPYLLGVFLGDGCVSESHARFVSIDNEIIDRVKGICNDLGLSVLSKGITHTISSESKPCHKGSRRMVREGLGVKEEYASCGEFARIHNTKETTIIGRCLRNSIVDGWEYSFTGEINRSGNIMLAELESLEILGKRAWEKSIPPLYKYASVEDRLELLRGLMDTDGSVKPDGKDCVYYTTSEQLAKDVSDLVFSLGGAASTIRRDRVNETKDKEIKARRVSYEVYINFYKDINPFYLSRKRDRFTFSKANGHNLIKSVVFHSEVETQCLLLDNEDHLYVTDDFIVTHNTLLEKLEPVMYSYTANINKIFGVSNASDSLLKSGQVEWKPVAYLRGCQFDHSIVILDEAQNLDVHCIKTLITRIGKSSKLIIMGDLEQYDRGNAKNSGMETIKDILKDSPYVGVIEFKDSECVRNPIITDIVKKLRVHNI